ncbi:DUF456 domain-containing protein [Fodinibius sediminis]|uniref:DUF456 domain-containing protein n=1 Tax=Fodinibius sediminis TaxID=1214077 RepID=A0A521AQR1_9BACT|nr:DUF456 domain-containing protein [Fodinibius sediminis]SMO37125.1 hypothetical protein SAMN06265218_101291 [Fodinibius sediminis]
METILIITGGACIIAGFLGSFLPVIPGTPIAYCGLLALQVAVQSFSTTFLVVWALIVILIMVLDNVIPAYGTKKFGGSAYGVWGSLLGMLAGVIFFPPAGMVVGPLAGAFAGELIAGKTTGRALKSAIGSFAGLLVNTLMKIIASGIMGYYFAVNVF